LVTFVNAIVFSKDASDKFYYYTIAKDYEWSFVALQVVSGNSDEENPILLPFEKVDKLPEDLQNVSPHTDNLLVFKIKLGDEMKNEGAIAVKEYHKGRMEPYPKVIRVYEKQKVELFDSKYFLSIYPTKSSTCIYYLSQKDLHY
jgi:hypothetical protein